MPVLLPALSHSQVKLAAAAVVKERRLVWNLMLKKVPVTIAMKH
jgi:hypothetical protein